ncbi:MAG: class I SAM-dependent methyltransferase [Peptostreptococcaceae bacterium]|nr:class I SAM-dependent methyltransferase [Peptostreptococcaceae bacterium]
MKIKLEGVMETLLITLDVRARDHRSPDPVLNDRRAAEIVDRIDYDFTDFQNVKQNYHGILARAKVMDNEVKKFIQKYPDAHIVSIGSGLDTRFDRLDNGKIHWYDIDFPEVIEIRRKLLPENARVKFIGRSALDESWTNEIDCKGKKLLIISEGMIMYLKPEDVKKFLHILTDRFDDFELHLDCVSKRAVNRASMNKAVKKTKSEYHFGVTDGREISALNPKLKQIGYINFTDELKRSLRGIEKLFIPLIYLFNNRLVVYTHKKD